MTAKKFLYYSVFEFAACFTCREVFFVDEPVLTVPKLYVSLPTCLLRVVDNDSGEELTRVFQKVAPNNLKKNKVSLYCLLCFKLLETKIENIHSANAANERSQENIKKARFGSLLSNWRCKTITHLHALKESVRHAKFLAPCLVYPCRDYLLLNFEHWCHITFGTDTFTRRKLGVPCLKIVSTVPKIWLAVQIFLTRVNGVYVVTPLFPYSEPVFSECHVFFRRVLRRTFPPPLHCIVLSLN